MHSGRTTNVSLATSVESGRSRYSGGGRDTTLREALREILRALPPGPGSIISTISPPTTSSLVLPAGDETSDSAFGMGDRELEREGFSRGGIAEGVWASVSSAFT